MSEITTSEPMTITRGAVIKKSAKIGLVTMMAICIGLVIVQGAMISALQGIGISGAGFIAAMLAALVISQCNAMSFAELSLMFPEEGTLATYTQKAIGHFPAIVSVFSGYVVVAILAIPVEMFLVDAMVSQLLPGVFAEKVIPLLLLGFLTVANLIGTDIFAKVQNTLAFILVFALVALGVVAVTGIDQPHLDAVAGTPVNWDMSAVTSGSFIPLIALAMWLFVGAEYICPMIKEVKNPTRNIPRAMQLSLLVIFFIFLAFVIGASFYLDQETLLSDGIPYLDYANAVFGPSGLLIATIMGLAATCSTMNTILAGLPRMLHGMAHDKQAFPQLKALNRFGNPWVATTMMAVLTCIPFLSLGIDSVVTLVLAAATCYMLAYIVAHIDVLVLRKRLPNHPRPYQSPWFPIPQLLGIVAMFYVGINGSPAPEMTAMIYGIAGGMLAIICVIAALWVKFYLRRGLFEPDLG